MAVTFTSSLSLSSRSPFSLSSFSSSSSSSFPLSLQFHGSQVCKVASKIGLNVRVKGSRSDRDINTLWSFNSHVDQKRKTDLKTWVPKATADSTTLPSDQPVSSKKGKNVKYPRKKIDLYQVIQCPIITEAAIKNIADENSLMFTVDVRADKSMIKDAVKKILGVQAKKVNTLIRPDGTKKAYVQFAKQYNASDVAKTIGIFPGGK